MLRPRLGLSGGQYIVDRFRKVVDACHTEPYTVVKNLDDEMHQATGFSALRGGLMLEILAYVATMTDNRPLRDAIFANGVPYRGANSPRTLDTRRRSDQEMRILEFHRLLHDGRVVMTWNNDNFTIALLAKMLAFGWLSPSTYHLGLIWKIFEDKSDSSADPADEQDAKVIFDVHNNFGFFESNWMKPMVIADRLVGGVNEWLAKGFKSQAPISMLRYIMAGLPMKPIKSQCMHDIVGAEILEKRGDAGVCELLAFLVDEQGFDINAKPLAACRHPRSGIYKGKCAHSPLHAASIEVNASAVKFLLDRGAKTVHDKQRLTPYQRAMEVRAPDVCRVWISYFQDRALSPGCVAGPRAK
jgi:hypothetical protein